MNTNTPSGADDLREFKIQDEAFTEYLTECDECAIVPDAAGAFNWAWNRRATLSIAQEAPAQAVAIYNGRCTIDCGEHGHHDIELLKLIPEGSKLYTAPPKAQPMSEWQPIETAPKDGQPIILGRSGNDDVCPFSGQGRWYEEDHDGPDNMGHDAGFLDDEFQFFSCARSFGNPAYQSAGTQPTHWMPLPEPPEAERHHGITGE